MRKGFLSFVFLMMEIQSKLNVYLQISTLSMNNKSLKQLFIAILVAICSAIVAFFTSCGTSYKSVSSGHSVILTTDTTHVVHGGSFHFNPSNLR